MFKRLRFFSILFVILLLLTACNPSGNGVAMGTWYSYSIPQKTQVSVEENINELLRSLTYYLDPTISKSDIALINATPQNPVEIGKDTVDVLNLAQDLHAKTKGAYQPFIHPLMQVWDFSDAKKLPSQGEIDMALQQINNTKLTIVPKDNVAMADLGNVGSGLYLGKMACGYVTDRILTNLIKSGCTSAIFDLGDTLGVIGNKSQNKPWSIGLKHPRKKAGEVYGVLTLSDQCLSMISDNDAVKIIDGVRYHNVLSPFTGKPADSDLISVTIVGKSAATCAALSQAVFILGQKDGMAMMRENFPEYSAILVTKDKKIMLSKALANALTLKDFSYQIQSME